MQYTASITIMPHKELLDPQGKAVMNGLENLQITAIQDVRIGKYITLAITADTEEKAAAIAEEAANKLLANPVMEMYDIEIFAV